MPWVAPVVMAGASLASGAMAKGAQDGATRTAQEAYERSVHDLEQIGIPSIEAQKLVMEEYQSQGQWTPELEEAVSQGDSNMLGVSTDPEYKKAQLKALGKLQEIGDSGGMTLEDKAGLEKVQGNISADNRGAREAIMQDAQQRGGYGSGSSLAAQLMAQQSGASQAHEAGLATAASAQKRALDAIQQGGQLGTQLRGQEFDEAAAKAKAQDTIQQWNAANRQDVASRNATNRNTASRYNLDSRQNLANSNVDTRNKQQAYNKGLYQTEYQNKMDQEKAKAAARAGQAQSATAAGNQAAQTWAGIGSAVTQGAAAAGQQYNSNEQRELDRQAYAS